MKILVLSDSHNKTTNVTQVLKKIHKTIAVVVHLGDCVEDIGNFEWLYPNIDFYTIRGNCDYSRFYENELILNIANKTIFLTHGSDYGVKHTLSEITAAAKNKKANICLFGHTHTPTVFYDEDITFLNPGSISLPRHSRFPTYGVIEITESGNVLASVVEIRKDEYTIIC